MNCNICNKPGAKNYGSDPNEPDYEYNYCDRCAGVTITTNGKSLKEAQE